MYGDKADVVWRGFRAPLLLSLHCVVSLASLAVALRGDNQAVLELLVGALHLIAWNCCRKQAAAQDHLKSQQLARKARILANSCACVSWFIRALGHYRWSIQSPPMSPFIARALMHGWGHATEVIISTVEQVHAQMLFPSWLTAACLAAHLRVLHYAYTAGGVLPGSAFTALWMAAEFVLPHLAYLYMYKSLQSNNCSSRGAAGAHPAAAVTAATTTAQLPAGLPLSDKAVSDVKDTPLVLVECGCTPEQSPSRVTESSAVSLQGGMEECRESTYTSQTDVHAESRPIHVAAEPSMAVGSTSSSPTAAAAAAAGLLSSCPNPNALLALRNARGMLQQSPRSYYQYKSALTQPQAIIKLKDTEPHQLSPDVIDAANRMLAQRGIGLAISRACVRKGCTLLAFDLVQQSPDAAGVSGPSNLEGLLLGGSAGGGAGEQGIAGVVQAWLQSLLSPGTPIPDGARAFLSLGGGSEVEATWHQESRSWVVKTATSTLSSAAPQLQLLYTDCPVVWLPRTLPSCTATGRNSRAPNQPAASHSNHRVTLVLQPGNSLCGRSLQFEGSDPTSAPPEPQADDGPVVIQCVAHGSWGSCLPVAVVAAQPLSLVDTADTPNAAAGTTPATAEALTLDVDLSSVPHAGLVQLELWHGRQRLSTAPLLLLPPADVEGAAPLSSADADEASLSSTGTVGDNDVLLQELQQLVELASAVGGTCQGEEGHEATLLGCSGADGGSEGCTALLSDLGQVLSTVECIKQHWAAQAGQVSTSTTGGAGLCDSSTAATAANNTASSSSSSGNAEPDLSWGGVVSSTARRHACDPTLLSSMLALGEGVLEFVESAGGLPQTSALVADSVATIRLRLQQLVAPSASTTGESFCASTTPPSVPAAQPKLDATSSSSGMGSAGGSAPSAQLMLKHPSDTADTTNATPEGASGKPLPSSSGSSVSDRDQLPTREGLRLRHLRSPVSTGDTPTTTTQSPEWATCSSRNSGGISTERFSSLYKPAASSSQPSSPVATIQGPLARPSLLNLTMSAFTGFRQHPQLEEQYKHWVAVQWRGVALTNSLLVLMWVVASMGRHMNEGLGGFLAQMPVHFMVGAPFMVTTLLAVNHQHRWLEASLILHAVGRILGFLGAVTGAFPMPSAYGLKCRLRFNIWGELILYRVAEPMRVPALLFSHSLLIPFDLLLLNHCGRHTSLLSMAAEGLVTRLAAFVVGAGLDIARRYAFLMQTTSAQQVPPSSMPQSAGSKGSRARL